MGYLRGLLLENVLKRIFYEQENFTDPYLLLITIVINFFLTSNF